MVASGSHAPLVLHCDNVWIDPPGHFEPKFVGLAGGLIEFVHNRMPASAVGTRKPELDLGNAYMMPGLINTHVHLEFSASPDPLREFRREPASDRFARAVRNARTMLLSGVTTLRDCGSSMELLMEFCSCGDLPALPRLLLSGPPITVPGGHLSIFGGIVSDLDEISATVSRSISDGARSIKLIGSGGGMTPGSFPEKAAFSQEVFCRVAAAARSHEVASAAHVLAAESVRRAAIARFDSLEHCAFFRRSSSGRLVRHFDEGVAEIVAYSGVAVMPNLSTATRAHGTLLREGMQGNPEAQHALDQHEVMLENFRKLVDLGVTMICGTDAGVRDTPFGDTWIELELMARSGMSNIDVVRSASLNAARALKLEGTVGRIAAGHSADFVVLKNSPLTDISTYRDPLSVYSHGRRIAPSLANERNEHC